MTDKLPPKPIQESGETSELSPEQASLLAGFRDHLMCLADTVRSDPDAQHLLRELTDQGTERHEITDQSTERYKLTPEQQVALFAKLESRFAEDPKHYKRPENTVFAEVKKAIESNSSLMNSIFQMENTGGEPDVIEVTEDAFIFADCSMETPNRRDLTYYEAAQMADSFGVEMMPHDIYMRMQESGEIDPTTWSWLKTPADILKSECALFGLRENEDVMMNDVCARYHYAARGWRGVLRVPRV